MKGTRWSINELEYFDAPNLSLLVFHNFYPEGKQGGLEIIQNGERIATNGDLRVEPTPGQWSLLPKVGKREIDVKKGVIKVPLSYTKLDLSYIIRVRPKGDSLHIYVDLDRPLSPKLESKVSLNLELFPPAFFERTFHLGKISNIFPRQANGPMVTGLEGQLEPAPLATGTKLTISPEDPIHHMIIARVDGGKIQLLDGRNTAQNGWFIVRSIVPLNVTKGAVEWLITPQSILGWRRDPVISISQVGYHPDQVKQAVIELDPRTKQLGKGVLLFVDPEKGLKKVFSSPPKKWGKFLRCTYAVFDFTEVRKPGMYIVKYGSVSTSPFSISPDIFRGIWQPTLETYFPIQMCHMKVRDRYQVWHGACHLDDALQAPPLKVYIDGYRQGPTTETPYSANQHIPKLNIGGWHDAGDDDLAAGSQAQTTHVLALAHEAFNVNTDQTTVQKDERLVLLHTPDEIPDIVQQISHGVENLLSGYRNTGHSFSGIISHSLDQYVLVGDVSNATDNKVYDPSLTPNEVLGERSGNMDDRWAFTSRDTSLEYKVAAALAAASRTLRGYEDPLAQECLDTAVKVWEYEQTHSSVEQPSSYVPRNPDIQEILTTIELLITTKENRYNQHLIKLLPSIIKNIGQVGWAVVRALPWINDDNFKGNLKEAVKKHHAIIKEELSKNPYHVIFRPAIWGIGWDILSYAMYQYYLTKVYPELFDREDFLAVINYILGCHPGSNVSFVSGVGARSLTAAYGYNRADWSYIPGAVASGTALIKPDLPELKDNFPFLWQQTENVIGGAATYIFCVLAADDLLNSKNT